MIEKKAIQAVFERAFKLEKDETCLIVTDTGKEHIARQFYAYAKTMCHGCDCVVMPMLTEHGQSPPDSIARTMLGYDVELLITTKSISHTKARRDAKEHGARIASMPGITEEIINRCLDVDYDKIRGRSQKLYAALCAAKKIRVTTLRGTDLIVERGSMLIAHGNGGVLDTKSSFGNLPEGEVSIGPENANGVYVVDASFPTVGKLTEPLCFKAKDGFVTSITGTHADELCSLLDAIGPQAYRVAELGIGTHHAAIITGNVLEDEKVMGTCHVAIGNNMSFGGSNDVPVHLDGVITDASVYADDQCIMENGQAMYE